MSQLLILQALASGIVTGCVYALVALSLVIVFKSTDVVNFAGGELVMFGGYMGLLFLYFADLPYVFMIVAAILAVFTVGALFERVTMNKVRGRGYDRHVDLVPLVVVTIGLSYLLRGLVRVVPYTEEPRRLEPLFSGPPIFIGDVVLPLQDFVIIGATVLVMIGLTIFFRWTTFGKALRATSQNPRAAALIGIPVKRMRMVAWGIAAGLAGLAGVLLAPKLLMTPEMGMVVTQAFAAAIIGGFTSLPGCVVGGIFLGLMQNFVGVTISPQAISVTPFFVIMLVLVLRPQGFFGESVALKKV